MIDYKSPIKIIEDQLHNQIITDYENGIMKALMRYQIYVDKEELLKALQYDRGQYEKGYQDGLNADKWIPCEERLPEKYGGYLYTDKYGKVREGLYYPEKDGFPSHWSVCDYDGLMRLEDDEVIAWQQPPQAYKKEGAENE